MISLVTKAAAEAKSRSSKKVAAAHLKAAVLRHEQFDFLNDIVGKIAEAPAGNSKAHATGPRSASHEVESDGVESGASKKRKTASRRRKTADE